MMKCADLHSKHHTIQIFRDASNKGWGAHLEQVSTKDLRSDRDIKATHKCSRVEGGLSGNEKVHGPVSKPNGVGCNGQLKTGSLLRQGGTHSGQRCAFLWKMTTWCHHYQITL